MYEWKGVKGEAMVLFAVEYESTGYRIAATTGGRPEDSTPAEGDDERNITGISVDSVELPASLVAQLSPFVRCQVEEDDLTEEQERQNG